MSWFRKALLGALALAVLVAIGYGAYLRLPPLIKQWRVPKATDTVADQEPSLPTIPPNADDQIKGMYKEATDAREARLADGSYKHFLEEGLAWKTLGDFAPSGRNVYYTYAAFIYSKAGEKFPKDWVPYYNVGNMFALIGQQARAESAYKKAIEIDPTSPFAYQSLIDMLTVVNAWPSPDILTFFRAHLFSLKSDQRAVVIGYARYLLQNGMNREAVAILEQADKTYHDEAIAAELKELHQYFKDHPDQFNDATRQPASAAGAT
jgi:tetratricopeptide (TPR) repeat protein